MTRSEEIISRAHKLGLPLAQYEFVETESTPLPELPFIIWLNVKTQEYGADNINLLKRIEMAIELYTDREPNKELEQRIEREVLYDVEYEKYQEVIEKEDTHQTAYSFTVVEKLKKGANKHEQR